MTIEELRAKYSGAYDSDFDPEMSGESSSSGSESGDEGDDESGQSFLYLYLQAVVDIRPKEDSTPGVKCVYFQKVSCLVCFSDNLKK